MIVGQQDTWEESFCLHDVSEQAYRNRNNLGFKLTSGRARFLERNTHFDPDPLPKEPNDYLDRKPAPFVREKNTVGRNDPCPCGSGKKFKKCCMKS